MNTKLVNKYPIIEEMRGAYDSILLNDIQWNMCQALFSVMT